LLHPILTQPRRRRLFLALWLPVGALVPLVPFWHAGGGLEGAWALALWGEALAVPVLASWYVSRFATPFRTPARGEWQIVAAVTAAAVATSAGWLGAGWLGLAVLPSEDWPPAALFPHYAPQAFAAAIVVFVAMSAVHYGLGAADRSEDALRRVYAADVAAREAELRALRAQVNPHFLFNCLHSIGALVTADPAGARRMCGALADFFRDSLRAGTQPRITLDSEIALVGRYLEIERVRFGDRLRPSIVLATDARMALVPPLLLQPLVENAVRHGISTLVDGGEVIVDARRRADRVEAVVENDFDEEGRRPGTGVGLTNVRARLAAAYGDRARITAKASGNRFRVMISLPVEEDA
jgi:two-component system, LytTR family, sensor histidine kinase AlgZ